MRWVILALTLLAGILLYSTTQVAKIDLHCFHTTNAESNEEFQQSRAETVTLTPETSGESVVKTRAPKYWWLGLALFTVIVLTMTTIRLLERTSKSKGETTPKVNSRRCGVLVKYTRHYYRSRVYPGLYRLSTNVAHILVV